MIEEIEVGNWSTPSRRIRGRIELYTNLSYDTRYDSDEISSFTIERLGNENKFFGYGVSQKLELKLVDKYRNININPAIHTFRAKLAGGNSFITSYPLFYVSEVKRDENTNELSITACDILDKASKHTVSELGLETPYTIWDFSLASARLLGMEYVLFEGFDLAASHVYDTYQEGANFEGTETIREAFDAIAEATQTIYYINYANFLVFKRLDITGDAVYTIDKANYFTLESETSRTVTSVVSATELGDNVGASLEQEGSTQYVRDNPFWELRNDIDELVEDALAAIGGLTLNQFSCSWRGNPVIEIGDKINLISKDDNTITSYIINDSITYNGGLSQNTSWTYTEGSETSSNPSTLGEVLKKTYAKVDKANAEIEIVADETASLKLTSDSVQTAVTRLDNNMTEVIAEVNSKVTADDVSISIQTALDNGIERVTTTTGFTFNEEGLHISKTNSEITTSITEDGMRVYRENNTVLTADNLGVKAEDLHATTFLIVGNNSRFEDFDNTRTGCFYIGKS